MPFGLVRYQHSGQSHFITFSCYHRLPHLRRPELAQAFVRSLEQIRCRYHLQVYGYVVMPEHVHLLLSEPDLGELSNSTGAPHLPGFGRCGSVPLSTAIQALKISVSRAAQKLGISPLWQKRYYDHNVRSYRSFVAKLRYMHRNPVHRELCASPIDWEWSSFRHYATAEIGPVKIESQWTALRRSGREPHVLQLRDA